MSMVAVLFKIYPKEDLLNVAIDEIKNLMNPKDIKTEDIGFGIKAIRALFTFNNDETTSSEIEKRLKQIDSINEIEVEKESLI